MDEETQTPEEEKVDDGFTPEKEPDEELPIGDSEPETPEGEEGDGEPVPPQE